MVPMTAARRVYVLAETCPGCEGQHFELAETVVVDWRQDEGGVQAVDDLDDEEYDRLENSHAIVGPGWRAPCGAVWPDDGEVDLADWWACGTCDTLFADRVPAEACCGGAG